MGLSYLWRRIPHPAKRTTTAPTTTIFRRPFRTIDVPIFVTLLARDRGSTVRNFPHLPHRLFGVPTVKHGRPCDDPVTPGTDDLREVLLMHAAVDFDRQRQMLLPAHSIE